MTRMQPSRQDSHGRRRRLQEAKEKTRQLFYSKEKQAPCQVHLQQTKARTRRECG